MNIGTIEMCLGCNKEIDIEVCWCGDLITNHTGWENHPVIPMGCECFMEKVNTKENK